MNLSQLSKTVVSRTVDREHPVQAIAVKSRDGYANALGEYLQQLDEQAKDAETVLVLGRYNHDAQGIQHVLDASWKHLKVGFQTVHRSKGKEADHVVVLNLCRKKFPSSIEDDPLLALAMPAGETFPFAEERRLFYVALTRARRSVLLLTRSGQESTFLLELILSGRVSMTLADSDEPVRICPTCRRGTVTSRTSKYGPFLSCSRYPRCTWKDSLSSSKRPAS